MRTIKFLICGGLGGLIQIGIFHLFYAMLNINILVAYAIAFIISATANYTMNSISTFNDKQSTVTNYTKYIIAMTVTFIIGELMIYIFVERMNIHYIIANLITIPVIFPINYLIGNRIVWNKSKIENEQR